MKQKEAKTQKSTEQLMMEKAIESIFMMINEEKNAKNKAYLFIISRGLTEDFCKFCKVYNSDEIHRDSLSAIEQKFSYYRDKEL